jgi:nitrogen regulatory protein P-II 1
MVRKMAFKKITAIFRCENLEQVETALEEIGVPGMSVSNVEGYGEYANFFKMPPVVQHARIEIFAEEEKIDLIAKTIMDGAHTGITGDGLIAVSPVEHLYKIKSQEEI